MRLLDSSGVGREIVSVTPKGIVGGWYGRLLNRFGMNVFHWVLLDIVEGVPIALDEAKAEVAARFEASMGPGLRAELSDGEKRITLLKARSCRGHGRRDREQFRCGHRGDRR
jgi:hypothetical protein